MLYSLFFIISEKDFSKCTPPTHNKVFKGSSQSNTLINDFANTCIAILLLKLSLLLPISISNIGTEYSVINLDSSPYVVPDQ